MQTILFNKNYGKKDLLRISEQDKLTWDMKPIGSLGSHSQVPIHCVCCYMASPFLVILTLSYF